MSKQKFDDFCEICGRYAVCVEREYSWRQQPEFEAEYIILTECDDPTGCGPTPPGLCKSEIEQIGTDADAGKDLADIPNLTIAQSCWAVLLDKLD